jgi:prepilin-type processing-associated H-X9-DG protein
MQPSLPLSVALVVATQLSVWNPAFAATLEPTFAALERNAIHVDIAGAGRVEVGAPPRSLDFSLDVEFGPSQPASGGMNVVFADGSMRSYEPVTGAPLQGNECLVFFLHRLPSGDLDPTEPAVITAREDPRRPGMIFVKLRLQQEFPTTFSFEVPGDLKLTPMGAPPQASTWFNMRYPQQRVTVADDGITATFSTRIKALRDHVASGYLILDLPGGRPVQFYEPLFATSVTESSTGIGYIVILLAVEDVPVTIEALAVATVHPNPDVPGCDIWDFTSNVDTRRRSAFRVVFDAQGRIRFAPEP